MDSGKRCTGVDETFSVLVEQRGGLWSPYRPRNDSVVRGETRCLRQRDKGLDQQERAEKKRGKGMQNGEQECLADARDSEEQVAGPDDMTKSENKKMSHI